MTRDELLALAWVLQSGADDPMWAHHCEMSKGTAERAAAILRKIAEAQPVAWASLWIDAAVNSTISKALAEDWRSNGGIVEPLYMLQGIIDE